MTEHFNALTPAEAERLAMLAEELGESVKAIGKILRHGYDMTNPDSDRKISNRGRLEEELGDVQCIIGLMCAAGDLVDYDISILANNKRAKLKQWSHHQEA